MKLTSTLVALGRDDQTTRENDQHLKPHPETDVRWGRDTQREMYTLVYRGVSSGVRTLLYTVGTLG